jgi:hypothetical protein
MTNRSLVCLVDVEPMVKLIWGSLALIQTMRMSMSARLNNGFE